MLGLSVIKSTRMVLTLSQDGDYVIQGKGFGHGMGLCAFGANGFAKAHPEATYVDILKRYYTGVELTALPYGSTPTLEARTLPDKSPVPDQPQTTTQSQNASHPEKQSPPKSAEVQAQVPPTSGNDDLIMGSRVAAKNED
jgi:hypothetical protein